MIARSLRLAAVVILAASPLAAEELNFDSGLDAKAVLEKVRSEPSAAVPSLQYRPMNYRWSSRECATITLKPGGPVASEPQWLSSTDFEEECYYRGGDPRYGGGGRECHQRPTRTNRERVQIEARGNRDTYPWEHETFQACLEGPWLDVRPLKTAYKYTIDEDRAEPGNFVATPGAKTPMDPDQGGLTGTLVNSNGSLSLDLADRWASYYAGEKTVLTGELWRDVEGWFDSKIADFSAEVSPASAARVSLGSPKLEAGKKYYLKWTFSRVGAVSKPTVMEKKTDVVVFQPGAAGLGR